MDKPRRYFAILAISAGTALAVIDGTIANVALPTIAARLQVTPGDASLVVSVYQLVLVMALLPCSALGDRIGNRRLYQSGQAVFIVATLFCLFADNLPLLLLARGLQGLGAAAALSVSSALIRSTYPADQLGRGLGVNSVIVATASALSPTIGGVILAVAAWQWIFAAAIPFALASLAIGYWALPESAPHRHGFDAVGSLLIAAMFGLVVVGLGLLRPGQPIGPALLAMCLGGCATVLALRQQSHSARPILPLDLFAARGYTGPVVGTLLAFAAQMTLLVALPFQLQHSLGFSPIEVGAALSAWPVTLVFVAPIAGTLSDRIAPSRLGTIGMAIASVGLFLMAFLPSHVSVIAVAFRMAICGVGFGMFLAPNARTVIGSAPPDRAAAAGALLSTTRLLGQAIGASLAGSLLASGRGGGALPASLAAGLAVLNVLRGFLF